MKLIVNDTSTERGYSTVSQLAYGCPRKAWLNRFAVFTGSSEQSDSALVVGSAGHKLLAEHYRRALDEVDLNTIELVDENLVPIHPYAEKLAKEMFLHYRARYSPKELGTVKDIEKFIEHNERTARLDLVVSISKRDVTRIRKTRGIFLVPGRYIVDHKLLFSDSPAQLNQQRYSLQYQMYMMLAVHKYKNVKGTIVNILVKTRTPRFTSVLVPLPNKLTRAQVDKMFEKAKPYLPLTAETPTDTNPLRCYDWNRSCVYLRKGLCERI